LENARRDLDAKRNKSQNKSKDKEDSIPGLKMPSHIYEGCTSRFIAADESNAKADATIFADTGLIAMVCWHTHVIALANVHDAGEKQFNVIALLEELFSELPKTWRIGVLYDIGCQLHQSIVKVCLF
jgi:Kyakuja-Dileera-Zisupton transposase